MQRRKLFHIFAVFVGLALCWVADSEQQSRLLDVIDSLNAQTYFIASTNRRPHCVNFATRIGLGTRYLFEDPWNKFQLMNVSLRTKLINERVIGKRFGNIAQNYGAIACSMSHLNVLRRFLKSNSSVAIILEDDVIPAQRHDYASAADSMTKMLEIPRKLWNIIYLGFCYERCPGVTGRISKEERFSSYCWRNTSRQGAMEGNPLFHQSIQPLCSHALVLDRAMAVIMLRGIYSIVLGYDGLLNIGMCKYGMRSIRAWMPILDQDRKHIRSHIQRVQYPLENFRATVKPRVNGMVTRCKLREYNRTATEALYNRTTPVDRENWFPY